MLRINAHQFAEWLAFFSLEPWGAPVENWRTGLVSAVIANTVRDSKKRRKPFQPEDFMPEEPSVAQKAPVNQDLLRAKIDSVMVAWGGKKK